MKNYTPKVSKITKIEVWGIFVKLKVLRVFRSFCRFRGNVSNFLGFRGVLLKFRFWGYFGNFLGFKGISIIF